MVLLILIIVGYKKYYGVTTWSEKAFDSVKIN